VTTHTYGPSRNQTLGGATNNWPFLYRGLEKESTDPGPPTNRTVGWISRGGEIWVIVAPPSSGGASLSGKALDDLIVIQFAQMVARGRCAGRHSLTGAPTM